MQAESRWKRLEQAERKVLARRSGDTLSAADDLEPICIQMESADYGVGEAHGCLFKEAATVHILCCAALEAHLNSIAKSAFGRRRDREAFDKLPVLTKWEYLPRLCRWGEFEIGGSPFRDFATLVRYRNALAHYKNRSESWAQGKEPAFVKDIGAKLGTVTLFPFSGPPRAPWARALLLFWLGLARPAWSSIGELPVQRRLDFADKLRASQRPANHCAAADFSHAPLVLSFLQ